MESLREIIDRVLPLLSYDPQAPMLFSSGLFLFLFAAFAFFYGFMRRTPALRIWYVIAFSLYFYYKSSGIYLLLVRHRLLALRLLQVERHLPAAARRGLRQRFLDRAGYRARELAARPTGARGAEHRGRSGRAGLLQVHQFLHRDRPRPLRRGIPRIPEHLPARRHLVLPVPVAQLHDRHLPRFAQTRRPLGRLPLLPLVLSAAGRRPDRPRPRLSGADPSEPDRRLARDVRHGHLSHRHRSVQEGRHLGL